MVTEKRKEHRKEFYRKNMQKIKEYNQKLFAKKRDMELPRMRAYYQKNIEFMRKKARIYDFHLRCAFIMEIGSKCSKCGYHEYIGILEIHHINRLNMGETERRKNHLSNHQAIQRFSAIGEIPKDRLLLCPNCHSLEHSIDNY
jgi:hypothetical protein